MFVKITKYVGFCVYGRSYLIWSPAIVNGSMVDKMASKSPTIDLVDISEPAPKTDHQSSRIHSVSKGCCFLGRTCVILAGRESSCWGVVILVGRVVILLGGVILVGRVLSCWGVCYEYTVWRSRGWLTCTTEEASAAGLTTSPSSYTLPSKRQW